MREGCAALGRRLHREVDNGYTVDRERGGLLGGTTAVLLDGRGLCCRVRER